MCAARVANLYNCDDQRTVQSKQKCDSRNDAKTDRWSHDPLPQNFPIKYTFAVNCSSPSMYSLLVNEVVEVNHDAALKEK